MLKPFVFSYLYVQSGWQLDHLTPCFDSYVCSVWGSALRDRTVGEFRYWKPYLVFHYPFTARDMVWFVSISIIQKLRLKVDTFVRFPSRQNSASVRRAQAEPGSSTAFINKGIRWIICCAWCAEINLVTLRNYLSSFRRVNLFSMDNNGVLYYRFLSFATISLRRMYLWRRFAERVAKWQRAEI